MRKVLVLNKITNVQIYVNKYGSRTTDGAIQTRRVSFQELIRAFYWIRCSKHSVFSSDDTGL